MLIAMIATINELLLNNSAWVCIQWKIFNWMFPFDTQLDEVQWIKWNIMNYEVGYNDATTLHKI